MECLWEDEFRSGYEYVRGGIDAGKNIQLQWNLQIMNTLRTQLFVRSRESILCRVIYTKVLLDCPLLRDFSVLHWRFHAT